MRSSSSRPTGLSANAVTIAVRRPKQRRSPARDVVLSAALRDGERPGRGDPARRRDRSGASPRRARRGRTGTPHGGRSFMSRTSAEAARARRSISSKRPSRSSAGSQIHVPPQAATDGSAQVLGEVVGLTPPVGTNLRSGKTGLTALTNAGPPMSAAGNILTKRQPSARARSISVGCRRAGHEHDAGALRSADHRCARRRGDCERRPRIDRSV